MIVNVVPPNPPEPTYELRLTRAQLVALGVLSHRHEIRERGGLVFTAFLPDEIHREVTEKAGVATRTKGAPPIPIGCTTLDVDWASGP